MLEVVNTEHYQAWGSSLLHFENGSIFHRNLHGGIFTEFYRIFQQVEKCLLFSSTVLCPQMKHFRYSMIFKLQMNCLYTSLITDLSTDNWHSFNFFSIAYALKIRVCFVLYSCLSFVIKWRTEYTALEFISFSFLEIANQKMWMLREFIYDATQTV